MKLKDVNDFVTFKDKKTTIRFEKLVSRRPNPELIVEEVIWKDDEYVIVFRQSRKDPTHE